VCVISYSQDWFTWYGRQCYAAAAGPMQAPLALGARHVFLELWNGQDWLGEWGPFQPSAGPFRVLLPDIRRTDSAGR